MSEQFASTTGHFNSTIQIVGDHNRVLLSPQTTLYLKPARRPGELRVQAEIDILDADFQAVPLYGREPDVEYLQDWLLGGGIRVMALVGEGGSGKTRLAIEVLNRLDNTWQGGFLSSAEATRFPFHQNLSTWSWPRNTLVVVDYAATMRSTLSTWFAQLGESEERHSLRILLLERYANATGGWFGGLTDSLNSGKGARGLLNPPQPRQITPITDIAHRRAVLEAGLRVLDTLGNKSGSSNTALRALPTLSEASSFREKLSQPQWADPLILLMAAIICHASGVHDAIDGSQVAAVEGFAREVEEALSLSRVQVANQVARREKSRLQRFAKNETERRLLVHLYACVILCGELTRGEAVGIAQGESEALQLIWAEGSGALVHELEIATSKDHTLRRLRPDLLAEAFLLLDADLKDGKAVKRMGNFSPKPVAEMLILTARDFAKSDEAPLAWLEGFLEGNPEDFEVLTQIDAAIPPQTEVMRAFAVQAARRLLEVACEKHSAEGTTGSLAVQAGYLANYAVKLGRVGDVLGALDAGKRAVELYRELCQQDPIAFRTELALTLNNLSGQLSALGQWTDALESVKEAVQLRRELFAVDPASYRGDLANCLCNLANQLSGVGRREEALKASEESVDHYKLLYDESAHSFRADLASALTTLSSMQYGVGDIQAALVSSRRSVSLYRELFEENHDSYRAYLASALNNQACCEGGAEKIEASLNTATEALKLYRELFAFYPDAFRDSLAAALNNLSGTQSALNYFAEALRSAEEAVELYRDLYEENPEAFASRLASALNNLANRQSDVKLWDAALQSSQESVELRRSGFARDPELFRVELARSLSVLGDRLYDVGRKVDAREAAAESLRIMAPSFTRWPQLGRGFAAATLNDYIYRGQELGLAPEEGILKTYRPLNGDR